MVSFRFIGGNFNGGKNFYKELIFKKNSRDNIICNVKLRTSRGRNGMENDSNSNFAVRIYVAKHDLNLNEKDPHILEDQLKEKGLVVGKIVTKYLAKQGFNNIYPTFLAVYCDQDEDFISLLFGIKCPPDRIKEFAPQEAKHGIGVPCIKKGLYVFQIVSYDTHRELALWDCDHMQVPPIFVLDQRECSKLFQKKSSKNLEFLENAKSKNSNDIQAIIDKLEEEKARKQALEEGLEAAAHFEDLDEGGDE